MTLDGRVAIITGASRGIGESIAERFLKAGAAVARCARSAPEIQEERSIGVKMDIRDDQSVQSGVRRIIERFGRIDIVVNNAGISGVTPIDAPDAGVWLDVIQTNIIGSYHVTRAAVPHM